MKKLSLIVAVALATTGSAYAGGLNQAATEEVVEVSTPKRVGSGGGAIGIALAVLVLGGLAAASSSTNATP